jgi:predicted secreted protein
MIPRREKVAFVCHCVLNQSTRAWWRAGGAKREKGMVSDIVGTLMNHGVGAVQMDCPEFSLYGNPRPPRTRDEYDTPEFRRRCREIAASACDAMESLQEKGRDPRVEVVAVVGVENSPSCGVEWTTRTIKGESRASRGRGLLIEAVEEEMQRRGLDVPLIGVSMKAGVREDGLRRLRALVSSA